jgi:MoaA/NifB/PqqE/SkfB family radical SAM enzyme
MFADCEALSGFYDAESDEFGAFVWTQGTFETRLRRDGRFALLHLCYYSEHGILAVRTPRGLVDQVPLCRGWHTCVARLEGASADDVIEWIVAPVIAVENDARLLGVMLRNVELTDDERRSTLIADSQRNRRLNQLEFHGGKTVLKSVPARLRVNMEVRCNIPETSQACTYCAWDWAKDRERGSPAFGLETPEQLGDFYRCVDEVHDCSIGEPAMNKDFGRIVAQIDRDGKQLSLTSNGQLFTPKRRREVLGRDLIVYVSLDSATAAGYARYRNDRFDDLVSNLEALCREKKQHANLPRVHVSFITMRSNVEELPEFFALMGRIGVDQVKLRMLYLDENVAPVVVNNGYRFDYAAEILSAEELAATAQLGRQLGREHAISTYMEFDQFAAEDSSARAPLCSEPWTTMYVLRRGIMPCCYATEPIATWDQQRGRPLDEFLGEVFNSPQYQEIRGELAAGRLARYCLNTPSCPILKQQLHDTPLAAPLNSLQRQMLAAPTVCGSSLRLVPLESLTRGPCSIS